MQTDWGEAVKVAGVGFVTVFVVLIILALVLYGSAAAIGRIAVRGAVSNQVERKEK